MENSAIPVRSWLKMFANPVALCWQFIRNLLKHCLVILLREKSTQLASGNVLIKECRQIQIPLCSQQGEYKPALLHPCVRMSDKVRTWCCADLARWFPGGKWLYVPLAQGTGTTSSTPLCSSPGDVQERIRVTDSSQKPPAPLSLGSLEGHKGLVTDMDLLRWQEVTAQHAGM